MRSVCSLLSISTLFYGYVKLLNLHRTERRRNKDVRPRDQTWDLLQESRALSDYAILAHVGLKKKKFKACCRMSNAISIISFVFCFGLVAIVVLL